MQAWNDPRCPRRYVVRHKELIGNTGSQDEVLADLARFINGRPGTCGIIYARLRCAAVRHLLQAPAAVPCNRGQWLARSYCPCHRLPPRRTTCDWLAKELSGLGIDATVYHAGKEATQRHRCVCGVRARLRRPRQGHLLTLHACTLARLTRFMGPRTRTWPRLLLAECKVTGARATPIW